MHAHGSAAASAQRVALTVGFGRIPVRAIVVKLGRRQFTFRLEALSRANGVTGAWMIDVADTLAALARNAGQFRETWPWGGPRMDGVELNPPGRRRWRRPWHARRGAPAGRADLHAGRDLGVRELFVGPDVHVCATMMEQPYQPGQWTNREIADASQPDDNL